MSFAEIKERVWTLGEEERLELGHILLCLKQRNDPAHAAEMRRRMERMDAGEKFTLEDVERICRDRDARKERREGIVRW